ncbi:MAG: glycosyl transferase family 2 [Phycisphaerae bacterium]|nr:glycosyl transferase family 2 [Phycisphaerae bacterium]
MPSSLSVIVTTYEWPEALEAVLAGLGAQDDDDFEVVVADDGSGAVTRELVEQAAGRGALAGRLKHAWQEDDGFRAARCRNLAASMAEGSILVMLDGDCVPRPGFVRAHRRCRPGVALRGSRCLLQENATREALEGGEALGGFTHARWFSWWRRGRVNRLPLLAGTPVPWLGRRLSWKSFRTCNASVHRSDFEAIDGFDHAFKGWGYEDSDLAIRLRSSGVVIRGATPAAAVLHLWHDEQDRSLEGENRARLEELRDSGRTVARAGLSTLSA